MTFKAVINQHSPQYASFVTVWPDDAKPTEYFEISVNRNGVVYLTVGSAKKRPRLNFIRHDNTTARLEIIGK